MRRQYVTNISLSAIVLILFLAPVAGAEDCNIQCQNKWKIGKEPSAEVVDFCDGYCEGIKAQPAEEAKYPRIEIIATDTWHDDYRPYKVILEKAEGKAECIYGCQSDAEKWRVWCHDAQDSLYHYRIGQDHVPTQVEAASDYYCTKYELALLEEIREKIK